MSDYIPIEVISEILSRLPVTPLLKFRCVDKTWKALIDSPIFVKKHLERSLKLKGADTNSMLKLCGSDVWGDVPFGLFDTRIDVLSTRELLKTDGYPFLNHSGGCPDVVMGCCNGLFLVNCACFESALWNPSTRKYVTLPTIRRNPMLYIPYFQQCNSGFGYDKLSDDYKVLRIVPAGDTYLDFSGKTVVYSLKLNSYRQIEDFPYRIIQGSGGTFVFGALHWLVNHPTNNDFMVVAFDLGSEEYELVPLPLNLGLPSGVFLNAFEDCLSMSCIYKGKNADIWLMRERGNRDSWSKLLSLNVADGESIRPISYSRNGKFVILDKGNSHIWCYDLELKLVRTISCKIGPKFFFSYLFSGSLVPLHMNGDDVAKKKKEKEDNKKRDDFLSEGFKLKL